MRSSVRRSDLLILLLAWAGMLALYHSVWASPLVYEDRIWAPILVSNPGFAWPPSRSLALWSLYLPAHVFGPSAVVYHAGNLLLHALTMGSVWLLARRLAPEVPHAAAASVLVFGWHPLQSQAVSYVSARADLLSTFWLVAAVVASLAGQPRPRYPWLGWLGAAVCLGLAVVSKEIAVIGVGLIALTHAAVRARWPSARTVWLGLGLGCAATAYALLVLRRVWEVGGRGDNWPQAVGQVATAVWTYLALLILPLDLTVDHDWPMRRVVLFLAVLALAGLTWLAWAVRHRAPLVTWAVGWVLLAVLPRAILATPEGLTEAHWYLPMVAVSLAAGVTLAGAWQAGQWSSLWHTKGAVCGDTA